MAHVPASLPHAAPVPLVLHGAAGRMGRRIASLAIAEPARFRVAAVVDRAHGALAEAGGLTLSQALPVLPGAVIIDFSHESAFAGLVAHAAQHGMAVVSGTTGLSPTAIATAFTPAAQRIPVLHAQNMSVGVNVVFRIAAEMARALGPDYDIEIVEAHHNQKKDAPSGTAFGIADAITQATGRTRADLVHGRSGEPGPRRRGEIGMHALRLGDIVGDHTVYFVGGGERILLGHVAHDRELFARGALRAAAWIAGRPPGRYAMGDVLGL